MHIQSYFEACSLQAKRGKNDTTYTQKNIGGKFSWQIATDEANGKKGLVD